MRAGAFLCKGKTWYTELDNSGICYVGSSSTHRPTFLHRRFTMLERFFKSQVATVSDSTYCHRITDALTAAGIKCYCKTKDVNQRSVFDATRMRAQIGTFGIKPQYITEIFVDKENAELASHIIQPWYFIYGNRQQPVSGAAHCRRVGDAALRPERLHQGRGYRPGADRA